jgi:RNA polymerase sigma-B factor
MLLYSMMRDFEEYRRTGDRRLRDQLVEAHVGLAYSIARRFENRGEELDDLRQVALMALVQAVERFDPSLGNAFTTFAAPTITGTLKRHLRDRTWLIRPPRSLNERMLAVALAEERLTSALRRPPTLDEIAREGGWTQQQVEEATSVLRTHRLRASRAIDDPEVGRVEACESENGAVEDGVTLRTLVEQLPARRRRVVELRYISDLTQIEIARRLGVSQMHVSRMLAKSSAELRALVE